MPINPYELKEYGHCTKCGVECATWDIETDLCPECYLHNEAVLCECGKYATNFDWNNGYVKFYCDDCTNNTDNIIHS